MKGSDTVTDYEKAVKHKLIDIGKTQAWLILQIKTRTALYIDSAYLHKILSGDRNAPKIKAIINEVLNINE